MGVLRHLLGDALFGCTAVECGQAVVGHLQRHRLVALHAQGGVAAEHGQVLARRYGQALHTQRVVAAPLCQARVGVGLEGVVKRVQRVDHLVKPAGLEQLECFVEVGRARGQALEVHLNGQAVCVFIGHTGGLDGGGDVFELDAEDVLTNGAQLALVVVGDFLEVLVVELVIQANAHQRAVVAGADVLEKRFKLAFETGGIGHFFADLDLQRRFGLHLNATARGLEVFFHLLFGALQHGGGGRHPANDRHRLFVDGADDHFTDFSHFVLQSLDFAFHPAPQVADFTAHFIAHAVDFAPHFRAQGADGAVEFRVRDARWALCGHGGSSVTD